MDGSGLAERTREAPVGAVGFALARIDPGPGGLLLIAAGEGRAEALARLVAALRPDRRVLHLPRWDVTPGEGLSPDRAVMGRRMAVLAALCETGAAPLVIASPAAVMQIVPPPVLAAETRMRLRPGDPIDTDGLERFLRRTGWIIDDRVDEPGEAAIRGQVIDLFPPDAEAPVRIAHAEGRVVGLDRYDPLSQRTTEPLDAVAFGAASEAVLPDPGPGSDLEPPPTDVARHIRAAHGPGRPILAHWPAARLLAEPGALTRLSDMLAESDAADGAAGWAGRAVWEESLGGRAVSALVPAAVEVPRFSARRGAASAFARYVADRGMERRRVLLAATGTAARTLRRRVGGPVEAAPNPAAVMDAAPAPSRSWICPSRAASTTARRWSSPPPTCSAAPRATRTVGSAPCRRPSSPTPIPRSVTSSSIASTVSASSRGWRRWRNRTAARDLLRIQHAGGAVRMLPVEEMGDLWRYGREPDAVTLDRLDGGSWEKRRGEVETAIAEAAEGLAAAAAARAVAKAPVYRPPAAAFERFSARFAFTETADQADAIEAVLADLESGRPMDRLVCGDVGFGKTEVALRAAAAVALAGGQVAIVAPTTVLARQHEETVRRRFAGFGVEIAALSRFTPAAEARRVKAGLADGAIRIVVGTHAVAGRDVAFHDLGLMIVDEEQRFGTEQKAAFRRLADGRHQLALTATPIPRTLQGALAGLVDFSVIATPPARRQPVRTVVGPFDEAQVAEALRREAARGGQSFVVAPRIADLGPLGERLARILPELSVRTVHARVKAAVIDETLLAFARGEADVLLATSLIESGLDIPRANALVVWHADRFGLSELHQCAAASGAVAGAPWST